ncbi:hypothetical protein [uncultured Thermomonospora sp.]|uniref:hypothetical protein n=1 Tax=uncultured Thermomonospora sp. TaxID=671175 RepID=UPI00259B60B5|nr:hypothetical protein [uncultured Thermomonospora sp.]
MNIDYIDMLRAAKPSKTCSHSNVSWTANERHGKDTVTVTVAVTCQDCSASTTKTFEKK